MRLVGITLSVSLIVALASCSQGPADRKVTAPRIVTAASGPVATPLPVKALLTTTRISGVAHSDDGKLLSYISTASGRPNLWVMNADGSGARQMIQSNDSQANALFTHDGSALFYSRDRGGNESYDIFVVPVGGGDARNLTQTDEISQTVPEFSPDGTLLAIGYKPKSAAATDLAVMEWPSGKIRQLTHEKDPKADSSEDAWSPDGKSIFATRTVGLVDSDIFRVDVATGKAEKILEHPEKQVFSVTDVSRDGRTLLVTSNAIGGYFNAALLDPKTKRLSWLTHTQWSVSGGAFTPDGTSLLIHQNSSHPQELYALAKDDKFTQITHSANETLQKAALPKSQLVTYKSFDGSVISAFVWVPFNLKRDGTAASGGSCPTVARPSRRRMPSTDVQSYLHREVLW